MASPVPAPVIGALVEPTYSAREAATLLGRSYSWLDRRVRQGHFVRPDGTTVEPFRTAGGYRYFSGEMLKDVAECCYRNRWFSIVKVQSVFREILNAAYRDTGDYVIPN